MSAIHPTPRDTTRCAGRMPIVLIAGWLLAACSQAPQPPQDSAAEPATSPEATTVPAPNAATPGTAASRPPAETTSRVGETIGGDGSPIQLDPLTASELVEAGLSGELACAFTVGDAPPLLYGIGLVGSDEPAQGVVKVSGYVEPIRAPGGFETMLHDPVFTGRGTTIRITITGPAGPGEESPSVPATLVYLRADGASRTIDGHWQCGP